MSKEVLTQPDQTKSIRDLLDNLDDLIKGVIDTIKTTQNLLQQQEIKKDEPKKVKPKLQKV